jgi:trimeric autotransporter adhesin
MEEASPFSMEENVCEYCGNGDATHDVTLSSANDPTLLTWSQAVVGIEPASLSAADLANRIACVSYGPSTLVVNISLLPPRVLTIQFQTAAPADLPAAYSGYTIWKPFTDAEKAQFLDIFAEYESYLNIDFQVVTGAADPDISLGHVNLEPDYGGRGQFQYNNGGTIWDGWALYNQTRDMSLASNRGLAVHEIGHTLSLKHPGNYDINPANAPPPPYLPADEDNSKYSVMSYNNDPLTNLRADRLMVYDVAALQERWGANMSWHTGNDVYGVPMVRRMVIWDAGGIDTLDGSSVAGGVSIDLREGNFSSLGAVDNVVLAYGAVVENAVGGGAGDILIGNATANVLNGGTGADSMSGGSGNDIYFVENAGDVVIENANEGTDTVNSSTHYGLAAEVENLVLLGSADLQGYGNALANTITGNGGNNLLSGGAGADSMTGGAGDDLYFVDDMGDSVVESVNQGNDAVFSTVSYNMTANVETLILQGSADLQGYGNTLGNTIYGNSGSNLLNGDVGADIMVGGTNDDAYFVDNANDAVVENANEGNDAVFSTAHYGLSANVETLVLQGSADLQGYGNSLNNAIFGNSGSNLLNGFAGADTMYGGAGSDVYFVDNASDTVVENANEGNDTVFSTANLGLTANVENLILLGSGDLQGYGNDLANVVYGNAGNNLLDGGAGADLMVGGVGDDIYFADNSSDAAFENANEGNDAVFASANYGLASDVETLVMQGSADLQGYGSSQANTLYGNTGNNLLNGGAGADTMYGNAGNDTYFVDNVGDVVVENPSEGTDVVLSSVNYTLTANVEALVLQGAANIFGTGNTGANSLFGNIGDNSLDGGASADVLQGNGGNDTFVFQAGQASGDTVVDFAGNAALAGDSLKLVGYGAGATFTNIDATHWQINYNGGALHEVIAFMNGAAIDVSDVVFV